MIIYNDKTGKLTATNNNIGFQYSADVRGDGRTELVVEIYTTNTRSGGKQVVDRINLTLKSADTAHAIVFQCEEAAKRVRDTIDQLHHSIAHTIHQREARFTLESVENVPETD